MATLKLATLKALLLLLLPFAVSACTLLDPPMTKTKYDRVQIGMSLSQVQDITGKKGEKSGEMSVYIPGIQNGSQQAFYQWQNPDGSSMTAIFVNDKLVFKTQANLK